MVFLDVSKAFDKVYHDGLLFKMKQLGICSLALNWFSSYLKDRKQRVIINSVTSEWVNVNAGVPQGSILGPLLFLIFINNLVEDLETKPYLFADDTSLVECINKKKPELSFNKLNRDLVRINSWAEQWRVTFNASKTVYMIISNKLNLPSYPELSFNNKILSKVDDHTHLGITLNSKMSWKSHIERISKSANRRIDTLKRIGHLIPRLTRITIYKSMIRPILEYGGVIFDNMTINLALKLESVQRSAAIACTGAITRTSTDLLLNEIGWDSLESRRKLQRLCIYNNMCRGEAPNYLLELLPNRRDTRAGYRLRNPLNRSSIKCRLNNYYNSFVPKTTRDWNTLNHEFYNLPPKSFRNKYKKQNFRKINKLYNYEQSQISRHHTRLRLGLSSLREHLYQYNLITDPKCQLCGLAPENTNHYIFQCPKHSAIRDIFLNNLTSIPIDLDCNSKLLNTILFGDNSLSYEVNITIFKFFLKYMESSNRFS